MAGRNFMGWVGAGAGLIALAALFTVSGCSSAEDPWAKVEGADSRIRVVVSFPPLHNFVKNVGKEHVAVVSLCTTTGPHHRSKDDIRDALYLRRAHLFLINGLGLDETFSEGLKANSGNDKLRYVELGEKLEEKGLVRHTEGKHGDDDKHKKEHGHDHGDHDPHVWLGVPQAIALINLIRDELSDVDPDHAADYKKNAAAYVKKLEALRTEYRAKFLAKANPRVISFHDSMRYLQDLDPAKKDLQSYGIKIMAVIEINPGEDRDPGAMENLVKEYKALPKADRPRVITVEPQYPEKPAQAVMTELKNLPEFEAPLRLATFDPLETVEKVEELEDPDWYVKKMERNLRTLLDALP